MAKRIQVGGRIECKEVGGIVTGAAEILDDAKEKKQSVINQETDDELARLDQSKQDNLTFDNAPTEGSDNPVKSGGLYAAQQAILLAIAAINELIPSAASALNQLADKAFVNSSISTNTATFRGTSAAGLNEQQFLAWANGLEHDLNDYVFWQTSDAAGNTLFKRYKWNGTEWKYEYTLNNSTFTAEQWEAIQSGITALLVTKLRALPTAQELIQSFDSKQDVLTFDNVPTLGSTNPVKSSGIYNVIKAITDLIPEEATAQNQLADKADVAAKIVAAIPSWKGQYDALTDLQAVTGAKAGDMGCVKSTDSDGHAVLTFYQYSAQGAWVVYYTLRHYAQNKPATTGTTGDYPYNGMGRIELQKNIVDGVNTLTQAMITQQNTIYVIQYDFTLGEDITVPANCVLEFDGGSISGGGTGKDTITGNNTQITGNKKGIFSAIHITGLWNITEIKCSMFTDATNNNVIRELVNLSNDDVFNHIIIESGDHIVSVSEADENVLILNSNTELTIAGNIVMSPHAFSGCNIIKINNARNVIVNGGGTIEGDFRNPSDPKGTHTGSITDVNCGIDISGSEDIVIENINVINCSGDCIYIGGGQNIHNVKNVVIENFIINKAARQGISITAAENVRITNGHILNIGGALPSYGIDLEPNNGCVVNDVIIENIIFETPLGIALLCNSTRIVNRVSIRNNVIDGNNNLASLYEGVELAMAGILFSQFSGVANVENNTINTDSISGLFLGGYNGDNSASNGEQITISNNKFTVTDTQNTESVAAIDCRADNINIANNNITCPGCSAINLGTTFNQRVNISKNIINGVGGTLFGTNTTAIKGYFIKLSDNKIDSNNSNRMAVYIPVNSEAKYNRFTGCEITFGNNVLFEKNTVFQGACINLAKKMFGNMIQSTSYNSVSTPAALSVIKDNVFENYKIELTQCMGTVFESNTFVFDADVSSMYSIFQMIANSDSHGSLCQNNIFHIENKKNCTVVAMFNGDILVNGNVFNDINAKASYLLGGIAISGGALIPTVALNKHTGGSGVTNVLVGDITSTTAVSGNVIGAFAKSS